MLRASKSKQTIQYVTLNSIQEGVGASQVLEYVLCLSQFFQIRLISIEVIKPSEELVAKLGNANIEWVYVNGNRSSSRQKVLNLIRIFRSVDPHLVTHARSDLAFVISSLRGVRKAVWDSRSLNPEQTIFIKGKDRKSFEYLLLRFFERYCAKNSSFVVCITNSARAFLIDRHGINPSQIQVISTCANLKKFEETAMPDLLDGIHVLFAGTLSSAYDIGLMNSIVAELRRRYKVTFTMALSAGHTEYYKLMNPDRIVFLSHDEMPRQISEAHFGLSILKHDIGLSLLSVSSTKIAEFLASGRPVIVNSNQGDIGEIVNRTGTGVATEVIQNHDVSAYVDRLEQILKSDAISTSCRNVASQNYDLADGIKSLSKIYSDLLNRSD
jgi:glycosyltransferase involved in cell wall biosynthesis